MYSVYSFRITALGEVIVNRYRKNLTKTEAKAVKAERLTYAELAHRLNAGIPTVFTYHGVQPAELTRAGNFFFLTDI